MIRPYYEVGGPEVEAHQQEADGNYWTARAILINGDLRAAVGWQQRARINAAAARAAYRAWLEVQS